MALVLKIVLIALLVVVVVTVVAVLFFYKFTHGRKEIDIVAQGGDTPVFRRYKKLLDDGAEWIRQQDPEEVEITSFDGLKLRGIYVPVENPRACVLLMHGYRSNGLQDLASVVPFYAGIGCSIMLIDQRACGKSEGNCVSFGIHERQDALFWTEYLDRRFGGTLPILMHGLSLGAATVMMAATLPLPQRVCGIVADCGFTSPAAIIAYCGYKWFKIPEFPMIHILSYAAKLFGGFGYWDCDTRKTLAESTLPVFLIHGAKDSFVPAFMAEQNYEAAKNCKGKLIVPDASHALSYLMAKDQYEACISRFLQEVLPR